MGKVRTCGKRCQEAELPECDCWCGGLFHGEGGKSAREAFAETFAEPPRSELEFQELTGQESLFGPGGSGDRWRAAIAAAVAARGAAQ